MTTIEYLDAIKKKLGIASDYGLQVPLGVKKQSVSNYRNSRSSFEQAVSMRVARILEIPPEKVIADMEIERATDPQLQAVWKRIARKVAFVGGAAIGGALLYKLHSAGADSQQLAEFAAFAAVRAEALCIMLSSAAPIALAGFAVLSLLAALRGLFIAASDRRFA